VGQVVEARWGPQAAWHLAVVLGRPAPERLRLRWCFDGSTEEAATSRVRPAWRVSLFGALRARLAAEVGVMVALEEVAKGTIAARMEAARPCNGLCLGFVELNIRPGTMHKLRTGQVRSHLLRATGCVMLELFVYPKWCATADQPCALMAGTREQRWQAAHIMLAYAAGLDGHQLTFLPPHLMGECRIVNIPSGMMSEFIGRRHSNVGKLMEETGAFVFTLRERRGQQGKRDIDDSADMLEMMLDQLRYGAASEIAIFGEPRAQFHAEIKIMALIEERYHGYFRPGTDMESGDTVEGLHVDRVWLAAEFEDSASRTKAEILSRASGGLVESAGRLVFIAGTKDQRARAHEYLKFVAGRRPGDKLVVPDIESRHDAMQLRVPREVIKSSWLNEQLEKISVETKTAAFFDGWHSPAGWGRLVALGEALVECNEAKQQVFERVKANIEKALTWTKRGLDFDSRLVGDWWNFNTAGSFNFVMQDHKVSLAQQNDDQKQKDEDAQACKDEALQDHASVAEDVVLHPEALQTEEDGPKYSEDVLTAAPRTPAPGVGIGKMGAAVPRTPAPNHAPITPAPSSMAAPMSPVRQEFSAEVTPADVQRQRFRGAPPPKHAMVGISEEPKAKRFRGTAPPQLARVTTVPSAKTSAVSARPLVAAVGADGAPGVSAPCTPATGARPPVPKQANALSSVPAPCTPANTHSVPAPRTPAGIPGVPAPRTPAPARVDGAPEVPAPRTPATGMRPPVAARVEDAVGMPAPRTPAGARPPAAARVDSFPEEPAPCTPATGSRPPAAARVDALASGSRTPAAARVEMPVTGSRPPATARVDMSSLLQKEPDSEAQARMSIPRRPPGVGIDTESSMPMLPTPFDSMPDPPTPRQFAPGTPAALARGSSAPCTPAALARKESGGSTKTISPQTPAAIAGRQSAPQTPAFIAGNRSYAPQTPAFAGGKAGAPQTPGRAARGAPGTPAAISSTGRPVPQTPAAISSAVAAGRPPSKAPNTPAAILVSGPPSPTAAPPSRAPLQPARAPKGPSAKAPRGPPASKFAPRKPKGGDKQDPEAVDEGSKDAAQVPSFHHGMTYSEWAAAKGVSL